MRFVFRELVLLRQFRQDQRNLAYSNLLVDGKPRSGTNGLVVDEYPVFGFAEQPSVLNEKCHRLIERLGHDVVACAWSDQNVTIHQDDPSDVAPAQSPARQAQRRSRACRIREIELHHTSWGQCDAIPIGK